MGRKMKEIIEDAKVDLLDWLMDNQHIDASDAITEIADGAVPIYTSDLMDLVSDDYSLLLEEPSVGSDGYSPLQAIGYNVYDRIAQELWEYHSKWEEALNDLDIEISWAEAQIEDWVNGAPTDVGSPNDEPEDFLESVDDRLCYETDFFGLDYVWKRLNEIYDEKIKERDQSAA